MIEIKNQHDKKGGPTLLYTCGDAPEAGCTRQVAPGVFWIRMLMPFALSHINLWAIEDGSGWTK